MNEAGIVVLGRVLATSLAPLGAVAIFALRERATESARPEPAAAIALGVMLAALIIARLLLSPNRTRRVRAVIAAPLPIAAIAWLVHPPAAVLLLALAVAAWSLVGIGFDLRALARSRWSKPARIAAVIAVLVLAPALWTPILTMLSLVVIFPAASRAAHLDEPPGRGEERVKFYAEDGTELTGTFAPGARAAVLLVHGHADGRRRFEPWARALERDGRATLRFDHRAHGASEGGVCTLAYREIDDTARAGRVLATRAHAPHVFLFGASMGGGAVLAAASRIRAAGVIALAPASDFRAIVYSGGMRGPLLPIGDLAARALGLPSLDALAPAREAPRDVPVLVIHNRADRTIPYELSVALARRPNVALRLIDGVAHDRIVAATLERPDLHALVRAFLRDPAATVARERQTSRAN